MTQVMRFDDCGHDSRLPPTKGCILLKVASPNDSSLSISRCKKYFLTRGSSHDSNSSNH